MRAKSMTEEKLKSGKMRRYQRELYWIVAKRGKVKKYGGSGKSG